MRLLGLSREKEYSPGRHESNDALLLEAVTDRMRARVCHVDLRSLDPAGATRPDVSLVFSMCQGRAGLERLLAWERDGVRIVNSPRAALNTYRDRLPGVMAKADVPFPRTELVSTNGHRHLDHPCEAGFWLKRGDVHASVSRDVQWVDSADALAAGCAEFRSRGIAFAAV